ncbi:MAG: Ig-like domain-containing protein [Gammaproteobacteria bacterium]
MTRTHNRHRIIRSIILAAASLFSTTVMAAQFSTAPTALSINNVPAGQFLGYSMAVSANGQILLVGGEGTSGDGAAFVYTRSNGVWSNPVMLPNTGLSSSDDLGAAVALSADGTVALVGAPGIGLAYIYTYSGGTWSNPVALPTQGITPVRLGSSVALTPDGKTAFVGDPGASSDLGAMYVYTYNGTSWSSPTALPATGGTGNQQLGSAIALSSNDMIALVGAAGAGTAWVYTNNGSTWGAPVKLPMTGTPPGGFGGAVALSSNGQTALVGASFPNSPPLAFVYTNPGTGWSAPTNLTTPTGAPFGNQFVALSPSGGAAFVGVGFTNQHQGAVYTFANTGGNWSTASAVLLSVTGVHPGDLVGSSIVLTADGQELLAGAVGANSSIGGVYDYQSPGSVALAVTPTPASVIPGHTLTLDLSFNNADTAGSLPAVTLTNLVLTDTLPAGVTYVSSNGANGTCTHSGTTVTCTLASLPPGTSSQNPWQPSITVTTPATASRLSNVAKVSADEPLTGTSSVNTSILNDVTPTVTDGGVTTMPNTAVSGTLAATPGFPGQNLTFTILGQPTHGSVVLTNTSTGAFTYTPTAGFTGTDVFIFEVGDGIVTSAAGAETITVSTTQYQAPVANNLSLTGYAGQTLTGQLSATSSNGHALAYTATSQPAHGNVSVTAATGSFTYTPASGFTGTDSFTFTANDGTGTSNTATVSITVSPIPTPTTPPVAGSESLNDYAGQTLSGTLVAVSASGHALTYAVVTQPTQGSVTVTASTGAFTYTPTAGSTGSDSFTFTASDGTSTSNTATVSITILAAPATPPSSGGSSSGKSGGGGLGTLGLLLLVGLAARRRRKIHELS